MFQFTLRPFDGNFQTVNGDSHLLRDLTGCLPIRDIYISLLPDVAENFAANMLAASLLRRHHALRGRNDSDPIPLITRGRSVRGLIHAATGLAHALKLDITGLRSRRAP